MSRPRGATRFFGNAVDGYTAERRDEGCFWTAGVTVRQVGGRWVGEWRPHGGGLNLTPPRASRAQAATEALDAYDVDRCAAWARGERP